VTGPSGAPDAQAALARMREDVLGGRGAGTPHVEVLTHTRGRTAVGGQPVSAARQRLAEDTARARRDPVQLALVVATDRARLAADLTALRRRGTASAGPTPAVRRRWRLVGGVLVVAAASARLLRSAARR
jgi:hypothetical protein